MFLDWGVESLAGPAVGSLLFLAVFSLVLGGAGEWRPGITLIQFITAGIAMYNFARSAFETTGAALLEDKLERMIVNPLLSPLTPLETVAALTLAGATSGIMSGAVTLAIMAVFVDLPFANWPVLIAFALAGSVLFALVGLLVGLWADKWEHFSAIDTLVILPLGMLSGAFFSLDRVPETVQALLQWNPLFHAVNGFRLGMIGAADGSAWVAAAVLCGLIVVTGAAAWRLFAVGYKIKA